MKHVNYEHIGNRIRTFRQTLGISQERLAELADISAPHMSHIETGRTKLSLPTLVRVANALNVSVDELLCGSLTQGKALMQNEFSDLLSDCTVEEIGFILSIVKALKKALQGRGE